MEDNYQTRSLKIISGGQTGADRAALEFALEHNIPCGGWCPKGRLAEDGIIDQKYPLKETVSSESSERTRMNVRDSDGTLILFINTINKGTDLTTEYCTKMGKPYFIWKLYRKLENGGKLENNGLLDKNRIMEWIKANNIRVLNIAGPRESSEPGIYLEVYRLLEEIFGR